MNDEHSTDDVLSLNPTLFDIDLDDLEVEQLERRLEMAAAVSEAGAGACSEFTCTVYGPPPP